MVPGLDSLNTLDTLNVFGRSYDFYSLKKAEDKIGDISRLPFSLKVLLENLLRHEDGKTVTLEDIQSLADWQKDGTSSYEISYRPARVLMQDFTGVPAVVDLASMRQAMVENGGDARAVNPLTPVDLVIDHSVMVDYANDPGAFERNVAMEFSRNQERYEFLRWGATAFENFRVVPPGTGICHQVNLEYLAQTVWTSKINGRELAYPDTLVGTDSHTTMVNGLAVLGWGVGGIEAEAAMLGQPVSMLIPEVTGFKLTGEMCEGATATDLVLRIVELLRQKGVVGKFVEFYGPGLDNLGLADRATIANMAPEYGATCGFFPIDEETIRYLKFTGRNEDRVALVEAYARAQGTWRDASTPDPLFTDSISLDMRTVVPALAGPKRPQDRVILSEMKESYRKHLAADIGSGSAPVSGEGSQEQQVAREVAREVAGKVEGADYQISHGDVVIAAITSCTNTSNPSVMMAAGLVAKKAVELGLEKKPWVKTSLAPGSQVVTDYLTKSGLQAYLDQVGFDLVGYGCTTCIGNSGPLKAPIEKAVRDGDIRTSAVLSGNRNFEGRVHPLTRFNYLASPPLVVIYALTGTVDIDLVNEPLGQNSKGQKIYLGDLWPTNQEIREAIDKFLTPDMYRKRYATVMDGTPDWQKISVSGDMTYQWNKDSTYVKHPTFFEDIDPNVLKKPVSPILGARPLAILGDSITTDHISPAGAIKPDSPAGLYLLEREVQPEAFNSYGSRRGNHEVMVRGTFANTRIKNLMMRDGREGGFTRHQPSDEKMTIFDAAMRYQKEKTPLVVIGGALYGTGSSRDWAAKGTALLGVKAVITRSFERIHRSNLIGMGILPLQFRDADTAESLELLGTELFDIRDLDKTFVPAMDVACTITYADGRKKDITLLSRIDTSNEIAYYKAGGILRYVLANMIKAG